MVIESASDSELIARTLDGDRDAFDALVRRHYGAAFAVALAHTGNRADAEDVCHDAFMRAGAKLEECRARDRFRYWLCTIVRNHARNEAARSRVRRAERLDHDTAAAHHDPARDAELGDLRVRLEAALNRLPVAQREVVLLHEIEGWAHEAIAQALDISVEMSRQHLFRARRQLRHTFGEHSPEQHFHG